MQKLILGITQGDMNGIGYEVIIKALSDARILDMCTPVIYGSSKAFGIYKKMIPETDHINIVASASDAHQKRINIVNCVPDTMQVEPGHISHDGSLSAILSLKAAVKELKEGKLDILVTAPFNKKAVAQENFGFPGHTEYLIDAFGAKDGLMFLCADNMRVGIVTNHLPVAKVSGALSIEGILNKIRLMNDSLKRDFGIVKPKIAVLGLNPHAGDNGLLGSEETDIIIPAIHKAADEGIMAFGPYPPDGFFSVHMQYEFDALLAMYHDQGLIPFKCLAFNQGVNFTAGLPVVRTSPDHGTAYDIAGECKASPQSMLAAIFLAIDIYHNRIRYDEMNANPLTISSKDFRGKEAE